MLVRIAQELRERSVRASLTWVGAGDDELTSTLELSGVSVTGWVTREQVLAHLAEADVYIHTATWEAAPLTVLEAAELDLPILARDTPALRSLGLRTLWRTPSEFADMLAALSTPEGMDSSRRTNAEIRANHSSVKQREALLTVYADAPRSKFRRRLMNRKATLAQRKGLSA
jgi:glycosyltransferase involved in cell wall biosynthesis